MNENRLKFKVVIKIQSCGRFMSRPCHRGEGSYCIEKITMIMNTSDIIRVKFAEEKSWKKHTIHKWMTLILIIVTYYYECILGKERVGDHNCCIMVKIDEEICQDGNLLLSEGVVIDFYRESGYNCTDNS